MIQTLQCRSFIGSGDADIFYGSAGNDSFDAANGTGNYMSGGAGQDQLVVSDQNELESDGASGSQDSGEDLDLDTITINRNIDYTYSNHQDVDIHTTDGNLITDSDNEQSGAPLYRIDFADVNNISELIKENAVSELYSISNEYALFLRTNMNLSDIENLPVSGFTFDSFNQKIDVSGTDISVLDDLSGQLVLAEENAVVEGYIVQGVDNDGNPYNTVIENVEQVSLLSDDASYFGTGEISGAQEDIYKLIIGGDLGKCYMLKLEKHLSQRLVLVITLPVLTSLMVKSTIVVIIQILIEIPLVRVIGLIVLQVPLWWLDKIQQRFGIMK